MEHSYNNETGFKGSLALSPKTNIPENGADTLRKDWFNNVLVNIKKLHHGVEELRENVLVIKADINNIESSVTSKTGVPTGWRGKNKILGKITITPSITAVLFGSLAGFIGGGMVVFIVCVAKGFLFK